MKHLHELMKDLWKDEAGVIVSAELVVIATTVILGLTVAMVAVRQAIGAEFTELAGAFRGLDQSYYKSGVRGCVKPNGALTSWTAGSSYYDATLRTDGPHQHNGDFDVGAFQYLHQQNLARQSTVNQGSSGSVIIEQQNDVQLNDNVFQAVPVQEAGPVMQDEVILEAPVGPLFPEEVREELITAPTDVHEIIVEPQWQQPVYRSQVEIGQARPCPPVRFVEPVITKSQGVVKRERISTPRPIEQPCQQPCEEGEIFDETSRLSDCAHPGYAEWVPPRHPPVRRDLPVRRHDVVGPLQVW